MSLKKITSGINIPDNIYVIIEIPYYNSHIKYEISKNNNLIYIDRIIKNNIYYPFNYGYINKTLSSDGDNLDVIIPIEYKLHIKSILLCKPIGIIKLYDNNKEDHKIIAYPHESITDEYININDINDISENTMYKIIYFLQNYKNYANNKSCIEIISINNKEEAKKEILKSINNFNNNEKTN